MLKSHFQDSKLKFNINWSGRQRNQSNYNTELTYFKSMYFNKTKIFDYKECRRISRIFFGKNMVQQVIELTVCLLWELNPKWLPAITVLKISSLGQAYLPGTISFYNHIPVNVLDLFTEVRYCIRMLRGYKIFFGFVTEYLCHKWPHICYVCRNHNPILSSFMTYHRVCN